MEILKPRELFLRVCHKFYPAFIMNDEELDMSASSVYITLFFLAENGEVEISQNELAKYSKTSKRTVQKNLQVLENFSYISSSSGSEKYDVKKYSLLYSPRVKKLIVENGYETIDRSLYYPPEKIQTPPTQILHTPHANFSPLIKNIKEIKELKKQHLNFNSVVKPTQEISNHKNDQKVGHSRNFGNQGGNCQSNKIYAHLEYDECKTSTTENNKALLASNSEENLCMPPKSLHQSVVEDFKKIWNFYPIQQNRKNALETYIFLSKSGKLPTFEVLFDSIKKHKEEDRRWIAGYAPTLANWLKDERWNDEPLLDNKKQSECRPSQYSPEQIHQFQKNTENALKAMENRTFPKALEQLDCTIADKVSELILSTWEQKPIVKPVIQGYCRSLFRQGILPSLEVVKCAIAKCISAPKDILSWLKELRSEQEKNAMGDCSSAVSGNLSRSNSIVSARFSHESNLFLFARARENYNVPLPISALFENLFASTSKKRNKTRIRKSCTPNTNTFSFASRDSPFVFTGDSQFTFA